jgi:hypothetical protein
MLFFFHFRFLALSTPLPPPRPPELADHRIPAAIVCDNLNYDVYLGTLSITGNGNITSHCTNQFRTTPFTSVLVGPGVLKVGDSSFSNFGSIANIHFPATLQEIGVHAFQSCTNLSTIIGATGLLSIGSEAFSFCSALSNFDLPDSIQILAPGAFDGAASFALEKLPDSLLSIEESLLVGCIRVTDLTLGSRVSSISTSIWQPYTLQRLSVVDANLYYSSDSGAIYTKDGSALVVLPLGFPGPSFIVPDHGVIVGAWAFSGFRQLTSVSMPHVVVVEDYAFASCSKLSQIDFGDSLVLVQAFAFRDCSSLSLTELPGSLVEIDEYAFDGIGLITSMHFGPSLAAVHATAFGQSLATISISPNNPDLMAEDGMLFNKDKTRLALFPRGLHLDQIVLPTVRVIADFAFVSYDLLVNISIPSAVDIGEQSFSDCHGLTNVVFGDSLATIAYRAFAGDSRLALAVLPSSVTIIADFAFSECDAIVAITIPGTLSEVADNGFSYCDGLQSVTIEEGITDIRDWAFSGCSQLSYVSLPNTLRTIAGYAFDSTSLAYVWIPDSVIRMGQSALARVLVNVSIPGNVDMQENPFSSCTNLMEVHLRDKPGQSVCAALASTPQTAIFVSQRSGLHPGDTVCNGRNITIEPDVITRSFMPSRSKLPTQSPTQNRTEFPTRSAARPPTASPDSADERKVPVAAIVVPIVIVVIIAVVGGVMYWRRRRYVNLDSSMTEPLQWQSTGQV